MPKPLLDLSGRTFGKLTVVRQNGCTEQGNALWLCTCVCGGSKSVRSTSLRNGETTSCGCHHRATARSKSTKHGWYGTPEYAAYKSAKRRCTAPNVCNYADYGGRGIRFLFSSFDEWLAELGPRPQGHSVDRINNDGNYEPGNVRWATGTEQRANQRSYKGSH